MTVATIIPSLVLDYILQVSTLAWIDTSVSSTSLLLGDMYLCLSKGLGHIEPGVVRVSSTASQITCNKTENVCGIPYSQELVVDAYDLGRAPWRRS